MGFFDDGITFPNEATLEAGTLESTDHASLHDDIGIALTETKTHVRALEAATATVFDIRAYGAVGTGTADDTDAIQEAATDAHDAGGRLYLPGGGTYLISSPLLVGGGYPGGLTIEGDGWDSIIKIADGADCYAFDFGSADAPQYTPGLVMRNFRIDCNGANQTAGGGIYARGAVHCLFDHLQIDEAWEAGIRFYQDGTSNYGHHNRITNCLIWNGKNAATGADGYGVLNVQNDELTVSGCTFQDNGKSTGKSHFRDTGAGLSTIQGCAFVNGGSGALFIDSDSNPGRLSIIGNQFDSPIGDADAHIALFGELHTVVGNTFLGIGTGASADCAAIRLNNGNSTVANNTFTSSGAHAIGVKETCAASDANTITGSVFDGTFVSKITRAGTATVLAHNLGVADYPAAEDTRVDYGVAHAQVLDDPATDAANWHAAGGTHAIIQAHWDVLQTAAAGALVDSEVRALNARIDAARAANLDVILELAYQYPPTFAQTGVPRFKNQYGVTYPAEDAGKKVRDWVFSQTGRTYLADFTTKVLAAIDKSAIVAMRTGGGWYNELHYPEQWNGSGGAAPFYWGFSAPAQTGTDLATGMVVCPNPGYVPFADSSADTNDTDWADWYLDALARFGAWLVDIHRTAGWTGTLWMMHPGYCLRDGGSWDPDWTAWREEVAEGNDWRQQMDAYSAKPRVYPWCTWISGPEDYGTAEPDCAAWRKLGLVAHEFGLHNGLWGESSYGDRDDATALARTYSTSDGPLFYGYKGIDWVDYSSLGSGTVTLATLATAMRPWQSPPT